MLTIEQLQALRAWVVAVASEGREDGLIDHRMVLAQIDSMLRLYAPEQP